MMEIPSFKLPPLPSPPLHRLGVFTLFRSIDSTHFHSRNPWVAYQHNSLSQGHLSFPIQLIQDSCSVSAFYWISVLAQAFSFLENETFGKGVFYSVKSHRIQMCISRQLIVKKTKKIYGHLFGCIKTDRTSTISVSTVVWVTNTWLKTWSKPLSFLLLCCYITDGSHTHATISPTVKSPYRTLQRNQCEDRRHTD